MECKLECLNRYDLQESNTTSPEARDSSCCRMNLFKLVIMNPCPGPRRGRSNESGDWIQDHSVYLLGVRYLSHIDFMILCTHFFAPGRNNWLRTVMLITSSQINPVNRHTPLKAQPPPSPALVPPRMPDHPDPRPVPQPLGPLSKRDRIFYSR
jgi:hypothetical protein